MKKLFGALLLLLGPWIPAQAATVKYNGYLANEAGLAYSKAYPLNLNSYQIDWASFQLIWSTDTIAATTFTDGSASTFTITVASYTALSTSTASDFLTVLTTQAIASGTIITVNGINLTNGINWFSDSVSSATTALSLKQGINQYVPGVTASTASFAKVNIVANQAGALGNNMSLVSNTSSITANSANFTGGLDADCFSINNIALCANRDFVIGTSSTTTGNNIITAINANTALSPIVTAVFTSSAVITVTADNVGLYTNYATFSSSQNALTISGYTSSGPVTATGVMSGGTDSSYTLIGGSATVISATNPFSPIANPMPTPMIALPVLYSTSSATAIGGLTRETTYYVIPVTNGSFGLATSAVNAVAGTFITLTSSRTKTTADSFTLTPLAYSAPGGGAAGFWQASNDGNNWATIPNLSSTTFSAVYPSSTTVIDCGQIDYSWVRFNVNTPPTTGGLNLKIIPNGKRNQ